MGLIILWIIFSLIVAHYGEERKIGRGGTLLVCLIFSPLIGLIVLLSSEKKLKKENINFNSNIKTNYIQELAGLADLRDRKIIDETEFQSKKSKIMENWNDQE